MINNYAALPLGTYLKINAILEREGKELDKQVEIIAILADKSPDEVLLLPLADYSAMAKETAFLREYSKPTEISGAWRFGDLAPVLDFRKINTAQYVDFQAFSKDFPASLPQLLSVFLVPEGKAYNDGYDVLEVQERVKQIPFPDALGLAAFFFRAVSRINEGFPNLLGYGNEEDQEREEEGGDADTDNAGPGDFASRWGWIANVDRASELLRCPWSEVWTMPAIEWLNVLAYRKDKAEWEKEAMERWKRTH